MHHNPDDGTYDPDAFLQGIAAENGARTALSAFADGEITRGEMLGILVGAGQLAEKGLQRGWAWLGQRAA